MKNFIWAVGTAAVTLALAWLLLGVTHAGKYGAITSPSTNLDYLQLSQGLQLPAGPSVTTTNQGTNIQSIVNGSRLGGQPCYIRASSQTIAASSTVQVDCQATAGAGTSALNGVQAGDRVFVTMGTTSPTTFLGLQVLGASASSTAGYITLNVLNGTGDTFTWTAAASSSVQYLDIR